MQIAQVDVYGRYFTWCGMRPIDPIAIVGMSCRFPSASSPTALWELLCSGCNVVTAGYDDRRLGIQGENDVEWVRRLKALRGGFLDKIDAFDAPAFNISSREARLMDPQQRLMLELSWEALDDAGQDVGRVAGRRVGVYTGVYGTDYQNRLFPHFPNVDVSLTTGASSYALAGRVSYAFGFEGPCFTVHAACSSSLVAIHQACQALQQGDCELALAGGVNLLLDPVITLAYLNAGALSLDSKCKFGDASADGYVRSEGAAVVVLKTLEKARADGDRVHAIIRSSAVSHTGHTGSSLLTPGEGSQVKLFTETLERAGLKPTDLDYVEAHGTGTRVGDRIELASVAEMLRTDQDRATPCLVGSIKTNIGHTESAAGIAGLIKVVLCLKHGQVPPNLHFHTPNPDVLWDNNLFKIPTALTAIGSHDRPATASVSSFGITGTIACAIVEAVPQPTATSGEKNAANTRAADAAPFILALSARSPEALRNYAISVAATLRIGAVGLEDVAYTAALRRTHHDIRLAAVGRDENELLEALGSLERGEPIPSIRVSNSPVVAPPSIGWVFCGQGPQWAGMGMGLYQAEAVFRQKLDELDALIRSEAGFSVLDAIKMSGPESQLDRTAIAQPAIFAVQIGLTALLGSWGLSPSMIVGHSVGEVAAALTAGVMTLEDAVRVICARGRIAEKATGFGKMAAVELSVDEAKRLTADSNELVSIAAINSPRSITLSGPQTPLQEVCDRATALGRFARILSVDYPSHCALLDPFIPEMAQISASVRFKPPLTPLYSTVLGRKADLTDLTSDYWARNLRQPVLFASSIEAMARAGCDLFVEISPHPALLLSIKQVLEAGGSGASVVTTMRRDSDQASDLRLTACEHYTLGADPDWSTLAPTTGSPVALPPYPWSHESYWIEDAPLVSSPAHGPIASTDAIHPLLQQRLDVLGGGDRIYWQSDISAARFPWLADHRVRGHMTFPAAGYLVAAMAAANELLPNSVLADFEYHEALLVPETGAVRLQFAFLANDKPQAGYRLVIEAAPSNQLQNTRTHVTGRLAALDSPDKITRLPTSIEGKTIGQAAFYDAMIRFQLDYGKTFQGVAGLTVAGSRALAKLETAPENEAASGLHAATVDACLQTLLALTPGWGQATDLWLPQAIKTARLRRDAEFEDGLTALAVGIPSLLGDDFMGDVLLLNRAGEVILSLEGVRLHKVAGGGVASQFLHDIRWISRPSPSSTPSKHEVDVGRITDAAAAAGPTAEERSAIKTVMEAADRLAVLAVQQTFQRLGFDLSTGHRFTFDDIVAEAGIVPAHHKLLGRLLGMLCKDGVLRADGNEWRVLTSPPALDMNGELTTATAAAQPDVAAFWRIFTRVVHDLAPTLCGQRDAVELLFGDEGSGLLQDLYARHLFWRAPMRQLKAGLSSFVQQQASGQALRILEIGAGTGGLTSHLLSLLPAQTTQYVFTDRSRYFFGPAAAKFAGYPFLSTRLLDIEQDPIAQGFELGEFDIVVAANCLHATVDLRQSLAHAALLLKPGGLLLLQEETASERWTDLIFGLTEGWWRFRDHSLRPHHALLPRDGWVELLRDNGFDHVDVLGGLAADPTGAAAIIGRKSLAAPQAIGVPWLILADDKGAAEGLAKSLANFGRPCQLVSGTDDSSSAILTYLASAGGAERRIIDLRPLNVTIGGGDDGEALARIVGGGLDALLDLLHRAIECDRVPLPALIVVTAGSQATGEDQGPLNVAQSALWTLVRNATLENPRTPIKAIDVDIGAGALANELMTMDEEPEVALRGSRRLVRRLYRHDQTDESERRLPANAFQLEITQRGGLDGFEAGALDPRPPQAGEVQIRVAAAGVNFRDVLNVLGAVDRVPLGLECSGVVSAVGAGVEEFAVGDEVIAAGLGSWRSHFTTPASLAAPKPANLNHDAAAALPIAYLTAHFALRHLAGLRAGQRVLIHSAAGGVGFAALNIAHAEGASVLGTAGSPAKRDILRKVGVSEVFDSRGLRFAEDIRAGGTGSVDVVLNCLTGDFIPASLDLLANGGIFIEIGKRDIWTEAQVAERRPDVTYHVVELADVMRHSPETLEPMLQRIAAEVASGALPALPLRSFAMSRTLDALRFMQEARHVGKIVLTAPPGDRAVGGETPAGGKQKGVLITGGLGGLGLALARRLAERGRKRLILVGRNAPNAAAEETIADLRRDGIEVWAETCDMGDEANVARLIARCSQDLPDLASVFHLAGVLQDAPVHQLGTADFLRVYRPKVLGAWSLHRLTQHLQLDQFVMFSSWTAVLGSPGQANHASANGFLDALAHHRRAQGLPAQSINWGGWRDVGSAADPERLAHLARQGMGAMATADALDCLELIMASDAVQVAVSPFEPNAWRASAGAVPGAAALSELQAQLSGNSKIDAEVETSVNDAAVPTARTLRDELAGAAAGPARRNLLEASVRTRLSQVLRTPAKSLDVRKPFKSLGLDSLTALELRNALEADTGLKLAASLIFNHATISKLASELAAQMGVSLDATAPSSADSNEPPARNDVDDLLSALQALPEDEVLRLLAEGAD